jgi:hypothetical protein
LVSQSLNVAKIPCISLYAVSISLKNVCTTLLLSAALSGQTLGHSVYGKYTGPHSLGPYSLERDVSMNSLLTVLGARPSGKDTYCFSDKDRGLYLYVQPMEDGSGRVADVLLSSFPNCRHLPILLTTINPTLWKTPEGIGLGSTKEEVLRAYREPVSRQQLKGGRGVIADNHDDDLSNVPVGDSGYLYSCLLSDKQGCDDARVALFGFSKDKLIWIRLSNSE